MLPLLIALAVGVVEFGLILFSYGALQTATRETTREVAVNFIAPTDTAAAAAVRSRVPSWMAGATSVTVRQSAPGVPETNVVTVTAQLPVRAATPVRFFSLAGDDWLLRSEVIMKQEPPL